MKERADQSPRPILLSRHMEFLATERDGGKYRVEQYVLDYIGANGFNPREFRVKLETIDNRSRRKQEEMLRCKKEE